MWKPRIITSSPRISRIGQPARLSETQDPGSGRALSWVTNCQLLAKIGRRTLGQKAGSTYQSTGAVATAAGAVFPSMANAPFKASGGPSHRRAHDTKTMFRLLGSAVDGLLTMAGPCGAGAIQDASMTPDERTLLTRFLDDLI